VDRHFSAAILGEIKINPKVNRVKFALIILCNMSHARAKDDRGRLL